jgi:hypothetical protein
MLEVMQAQPSARCVVTDCITLADIRSPVLTRHAAVVESGDWRDAVAACGDPS